MKRKKLRDGDLPYITFKYHIITQDRQSRIAQWEISRTSSDTERGLWCCQEFTLIPEGRWFLRAKTSLMTSASMMKQPEVLLNIKLLIEANTNIQEKKSLDLGA